MKNTKMRTKNVLVSFLAVLALVCIATATVSASDITNKATALIKVDGIDVSEGIISVNAGDTVTINVRFTSLVYDSDVTVKAELEGGKVDATAVTSSFDVEENGRYSKTLTLKVPSELKDKLSDKLDLTITIDGKEYKTELDTIELKVQRPSYDVAIKSVSTAQTVKAGGSLPVEIVLKDVGYNDLSDLYVTVKIPSLGVEKTGYFGDLVALECQRHASNLDNYGIDDNSTFSRKCNEDNTDTVSGKITLDIPYGVKAGVYSLEVEVSNDDTTSNKVSQIVVENNFETTVYKSGNSVWIVNPTDNVVGYRIVAESPASVSDSMIFVPAGASKSVAVDPNTEGEYSFNVKVFTIKGDLLETLAFSGNTSGEKETKGTTSPIVILTVILAIIFIVLLIVLIVLIGKKPEKSGEFGESYY
jgi:hypothetical protein